ncbi:origin of replication complex subunit 4 [Dorcoceras hygrometricum]|uniref:Origin of replication complex subunit 4 n=1 Tax=Dorcoceras hygrometricum TaxID=472368 RepID=A0A2Z6ZWW9_9LAMI|nr:origin of replication complex subunit 4 [Dorcoceras hygrometricum]
MEKATEACKRKGRKYCSCVGTFQRSVAHLWKEDKIAFWSAEEFLEAFQREEFQQRLYILEATPIEEVFWSCSSCVLLSSERDAVRSFSWCNYNTVGNIH